MSGAMAFTALTPGPRHGKGNAMTDSDKLHRIAVIDSDFESARSWGGWMVEAANEREALVNDLNSRGHNIAHRFQARTDEGGSVS